MTHPSEAYYTYIQTLVSISYHTEVSTSHKRGAGSPLASQENSVWQVINPLLASRGTELCIHNTHMPFPPLSYTKRIPLLSECGRGKCLWKCDKQLGTRQLLFSFGFCCRGDHTCIPVSSSLPAPASHSASELITGRCSWQQLRLWIQWFSIKIS